MALNSASFLAGVGSVVVVLSTGFAGGYFFASPDDHAPPNRLQRVASNTTDAKPVDAASVATAQAKPEITAAAAAPAEARPALPLTTPAPAVASSSAPPAAPVATIQQASAEQPAPPSTSAAPEQAQAQATPEQIRATPTQTNVDRPGAQQENADRQRAHIAEAKAASRKRAEARKVAEQQRKQRELEVAASAVRHIIHDGNGEQIIVHNDYPPDRSAASDQEAAPEREVVEVDQAEPAPEARPFGLFGR
jgi:hypothetical protein